jgi:hypothetical protein
VRLDKLVIHADDIQAGSGAEFYGTLVREISTIAVDVREELDSMQRARLGLGVASLPLPILPGEVVTDNVIRRSTAAEVIGETFYDKEVPEGRQVPLEEWLKQDANTSGELITWRPNNLDIVIIHEETA